MFLQWQSIYLPLQDFKPEVHSFLTHCRLQYILCTKFLMATIGHKSTRNDVLYLTPHSILIPISLILQCSFQWQSIYLLLSALKQEEHSFCTHCRHQYISEKREVVMFSHTNISVGQWKTFGWTIMEIFVGKMFYYIMNCRINWSRNKRGVLQVFNSLHTSFRGYLGPKSPNQA